MFKRDFLRLYFIAGLENASNLPELLELALKSGINTVVNGILDSKNKVSGIVEALKNKE